MRTSIYNGYMCLCFSKIPAPIPMSWFFSSELDNMNWFLCSRHCWSHLSFVSLVLGNRLPWNLTYHPSWNGNPPVFASLVAAVIGMGYNCNSSPPAPGFIYLCVLSICVHVWRPEEWVRWPHLSLSPYFIEARSLPEPGVHIFWDRLEANKPQRSFCLCLLWNRGYRYVYGGQLVMWVLELELWSPMVAGQVR